MATKGDTRGGGRMAEILRGTVGVIKRRYGVGYDCSVQARTAGGYKPQVLEITAERMSINNEGDHR